MSGAERNTSARAIAGLAAGLVLAFAASALAQTGYQHGPEMQPRTVVPPKPSIPQVAKEPGKPSAVKAREEAEARLGCARKRVKEAAERCAKASDRVQQAKEVRDEKRDKYHTALGAEEMYPSQENEARADAAGEEFDKADQAYADAKKDSHKAFNELWDAGNEQVMADIALLEAGGSTAGPPAGGGEGGKPDGSKTAGAGKGPSAAGGKTAGAPAAGSGKGPGGAPDARREKSAADLAREALKLLDEMEAEEAGSPTPAAGSSGSGDGGKGKGEKTLADLAREASKLLDEIETEEAGSPTPATCPR